MGLGFNGLGAQGLVKSYGAQIVGHDPAEHEFLAAHRAGFATQGADHLRAVAARTVAPVDLDLIDHERAIGFKPAMGPAHHLAVLPGLDGVMLTLSVKFEVPVGFEVEGGRFQEVLPGRVCGRWTLLYVMRRGGMLNELLYFSVIDRRQSKPPS